MSELFDDPGNFLLAIILAGAIYCVGMALYLMRRERIRG
jgi:hypothetical protein